MQFSAGLRIHRAAPHLRLAHESQAPPPTAPLLQACDYRICSSTGGLRTGAQYSASGPGPSSSSANHCSGPTRLRRVSFTPELLRQHRSPPPSSSPGVNRSPVSLIVGEGALQTQRTSPQRQTPQVAGRQARPLRSVSTIPKLEAGDPPRGVGLLLGRRSKSASGPARAHRTPSCTR